MADADKPKLFSPGVGNGGMTQLHYDAYCGNLEGLVWCVENGLDVNALDTVYGYTPTHWLADMAAVAGPRVEMLTVLVNNGADINIRSSSGATPLMLARAAGSDGGDRLAEALLAAGAHDDEPIEDAIDENA